MYAIKDCKNDKLKMHFVIKTKSNNLRNSDKIAVEAQKKAFEIIGKNIKWELAQDLETFKDDLHKLTEKS